MTTIQQHTPWPLKERTRKDPMCHRLPLLGRGLGRGLSIFAGASLLTRVLKTPIALFTLLLLIAFLFIGTILQIIDPAAGILDIGILSVAVFGGLIGLAAVYCSIWLQELLWQPFRAFRKQFNSHFNQLTSWQQFILYFSVFFLLLYAVLWALAMVL